MHPVIINARSAPLLPRQGKILLSLLSKEFILALGLSGLANDAIFYADFAEQVQGLQVSRRLCRSTRTKSKPPRFFPGLIFAGEIFNGTDAAQDYQTHLHELSIDISWDRKYVEKLARSHKSHVDPDVAVAGAAAKPVWHASCSILGSGHGITGKELGL
jgi:hypothetical protein